MFEYDEAERRARELCERAGIPWNRADASAWLALDENGGLIMGRLHHREDPALLAARAAKREATRQAVLARRRAERAAAAALRPRLSPEEVLERKRARSRERSKRLWALHKATRQPKPPKEPKPKVLRPTQRKGPAIRDCAKSKPEPVKVVLPQTAHLSLAELEAMGVKVERCPPPAYSLPRVTPFGSMFRSGARAAA